MAYLETEIEAQPPVSDEDVAEAPVYKRPKVYGRTRLVRWRQGLSRARQNAVVIIALAGILFPVLAIAALTADLPITWFDGSADAASLRPSSWMTVADFWFLTAMFFMLFMARRYGAELVVQAETVAWSGLFVSCFAMIIFLAPQLTAADMPSGKYVMAAAVSWFVGPLVAVHIYDVLRGRAWWRGPLYGGLFGVVVQTLVFFPIAYSATETPWRIWWIADLIVKVGAVLIFLATYSVLRRRIRPLPNLGGHLR